MRTRSCGTCERRDACAALGRGGEGHSRGRQILRALFGELGKAIKRCEPGELVEVPDYISPIAIVYNLPGVEELKLEPETLAKIFNQEIENWNDPEIAKENPEVELPETRIVPVNRSGNSLIVAMAVPKRPARL